MNLTSGGVVQRTCEPGSQKAARDSHRKRSRRNTARVAATVATSPSARDRAAAAVTLTWRTAGRPAVIGVKASPAGPPDRARKGGGSARDSRDMTEISCRRTKLVRPAKAVTDPPALPGAG